MGLRTVGSHEQPRPDSADRHEIDLFALHLEYAQLTAIPPTDPVFDVAFSLLSRDEPVAAAIQAQLPNTCTSFLYSSRQREIQSLGDGLNLFPEVFRSARICVVLHRDGWGATPWTRLEESAIADRYMHQGIGFLVFVRLAPVTDLAAWIPTQSLWVDYQAEGPANTASYIVARLNGPDARMVATARTYARMSAPIARYQALKSRSYATRIPVAPEICDGCSSAVQFRPLVSVTLPEYGGLPPVSEKLCPTCARQRGFKIAPPPGMSDDTMYGPLNPSYADHVWYRIRAGILRGLVHRSELTDAGVTNVGAMQAGRKSD
jgi:hypothetical protein